MALRQRTAVVLLLALALDELFGDPPNHWHPVAWMGSLLARFSRMIPRQGKLQPFLGGVALAVGGAACMAGAGALLQAGLRWLPPAIGIPLEALALKMVLSLRGLLAAGEAVEAALIGGDLSEARRRLSWHLVSRPTGDLDAGEVAGATIESLAENTGDSVMAPVVYFALGGLPAALAHRFLNTADGMLGYHDAEREWLGKAPARLDDLANLLPARLSGLLIIAAAGLSGGDAGRAWRVWRRDGRKTDSPNAGHPMSAMAGALGVRLEKRGQYALGADLPAPRAYQIGETARLVRRAALLGGLLAAAVLLLLGQKNREASHAD